MPYRDGDSSGTGGARRRPGLFARIRSGLRAGIGSGGAAVCLIPVSCAAHQWRRRGCSLRGRPGRTRRRGRVGAQGMGHDTGGHRGRYPDGLRLLHHGRGPGGARRVRSCRGRRRSRPRPPSVARTIGRSPTGPRSDRANLAAAAARSLAASMLST